jgi:hypothetical protein
MFKKKSPVNDNDEDDISSKQGLSPSSNFMSRMMKNPKGVIKKKLMFKKKK